MKMPALRHGHILSTLIFGVLALVPALLILLYLSIKLLELMALALLVLVLALFALRATRGKPRTALNLGHDNTQRRLH